MKTILTLPCWLGESWRIDRYQKWLKYTLSIQNHLGFDEIVMFDNASNIEDLAKLKVNVYDADTHEVLQTATSCVSIHRYSTHIPRGGPREIPYIWRYVESVQKESKSATIGKIIFIDSDFYVLTKKLAHYVKGLDSGWTSLWCTKYGFPEATFMILAKDHFHLLRGLRCAPYDIYNNTCTEEAFPLTCINKTFIGDRYGETFLPQTLDMDYYTQWAPGCPDLIFDVGSSNVET